MRHVYHTVANPAVALMAAAASTAAAQDRPLETHFSEVYRAGGIDAPAWASFTFSTDRLGFDEAGNLYIVDGVASHVIVIDRLGGFVNSLGRAGEGPGEFESMINIVVWRDGGFAVADGGKAAFHVFGSDGNFVRYVRHREGTSPGLSWMVGTARPDPRGAGLVVQGAPAVVTTLSRLFDDMFETEAAGLGERQIVGIDLSGEAAQVRPVLDVWHPPRHDAASGFDFEDLFDPAAQAAMVVGDKPLFEPEFHWDILPDGTVAYSDSSAYEIKLADLNGKVTQKLRRSIDPEPVTRSIRSRMVEQRFRKVRERAENGATLLSSQPEYVRALRGKMEQQAFYEEVPVVRGLKATWDGALWIQRRGEDPWDDLGPIDVFSPARQYVGTFPAGATKMPVAFGPDGLVAFWETGELDVPTLVVRRLPAAVR